MEFGLFFKSQSQFFSEKMQVGNANLVALHSQRWLTTVWRICWTVNMFISTLSISYNNTWSFVTTTATRTNVQRDWHNLASVFECLCWVCSFIWSFMSIHIISQATDEVPMMQQQSVQQQKTAPGVGFQPWVQRHARLTPATHSRHRSLSSSLCTDLQLPEHTHTTLSPLRASCLCWSRGFCSVLPRFWPTKNCFFAGNGFKWLFMAHRPLFPPPLVD